MLFSAGDADGAAGDVVAESVALDGCPAFDGASYGDADGLLSDDLLQLDHGVACELAASCALGSLDEHLWTVEAADCAANTANATGTVSFEPAVAPQDCQIDLSLARLPDGSTQVSGTPVFPAQGYDIVRGELSSVSESAGVVDLGAVSCLGSGLPQPTVVDDTDPAPQVVWFYLARWVFGPTTTEYGWSSSNQARVPASGDCPPAR
jgi:hypothetical protein